MPLSVMEPDQVRNLADNVLSVVGRSAASFACGCSRRFDVALWAKGDSYPDDEQLERLCVIKDVLDAVSQAESPSVAVAWFVGRSCGEDGEMSPAEAVRVGNFDDARASAQRMVNDCWT